MTPGAHAEGDDRQRPGLFSESVVKALPSTTNRFGRRRGPGFDRFSTLVLGSSPIRHVHCLVAGEAVHPGVLEEQARARGVKELFRASCRHIPFHNARSSPVNCTDGSGMPCASIAPCATATRLSRRATIPWPCRPSEHRGLQRRDLRLKLVPAGHLGRVMRVVVRSYITCAKNPPIKLLPGARWL